jgi:hypothetical protein
MKRKYRLLREAAYERGAAEYDGLVSVPTFRDFVALYIAEGYKRSRHTASICNSDPAVVVIAAAWMTKRFWGDTLGVPPDVVRLHPKSNSARLRGRVWRCPYGVASVAVHDTYFRARIGAWIDRIKASWQ